MTVLDEILAAKRDEVTMLHRPQVRGLLRAQALEAPPVRPFDRQLGATGESEFLAVIAEIKRRSPSKGVLAPDLDAAATAKAYEAGGADCLSVLTDRRFFGGSVDDLREAREAVGIPVLRKDFTIDEVQVFEARAIGADAVLLIVAAVPDVERLKDLHGLAVDLGMAALVEVHDEPELDVALEIGARNVGVNARDLGSFAEDLTVSERMVVRIPGDVRAVAESAIRSPADAARMAAAGFDAVLVGEMFVRADDPVEAVRSMSSITRTGRRR